MTIRARCAKCNAILCDWEPSLDIDGVGVFHIYGRTTRHAVTGSISRVTCLNVTKGKACGHVNVLACLATAQILQVGVH